MDIDTFNGWYCCICLEVIATHLIQPDAGALAVRMFIAHGTMIHSLPVGAIRLFSGLDNL
nr:MAG TPA: hypothetical protein [Inoviridae sp.]